MTKCPTCGCDQRQCVAAIGFPSSRAYWCGACGTIWDALGGAALTPTCAQPPKVKQIPSATDYWWRYAHGRWALAHYTVRDVGNVCYTVSGRTAPLGKYARLRAQPPPPPVEGHRDEDAEDAERFRRFLEYLDSLESKIWAGTFLSPSLFRSLRRIADRIEQKGGDR